MLILTGQIGKSILIGDNIRITCLDIVGKQVKLGIEAPEDVLIYREELYLRILRQQGNCFEIKKTKPILVDERA